MSPPQWLLEAARTDPVLNAYLRLWPVTGADAAFWESLAKELAAVNVVLRKTAIEALAIMRPIKL